MVGNIKFLGQFRITCRDFVVSPRAVTMPLPRDEDWTLDVERKRYRLERGGMAVLEQVADQLLVLAGVFPRPPFGVVGYARVTHDGQVRSHVLEQPDMSVVKDRDLVHGLSIARLATRAIDDSAACQAYQLAFD